MTEARKALNLGQVERSNGTKPKSTLQSVGNIILLPGMG